MKMKIETTELLNACEDFSPSSNDIAQKGKSVEKPPTKEQQPPTKEKHPGQRELLISSADADILWQDLEGTAYATIKLASGAEANREIRSSGYKKVLIGRIYVQTGSGASKQALEEALCTIEARAQHEGVVHEPSMRCAFLNDRVYYDTCDSSGTVIEITKDGWKKTKTTESKIKFIQTRSMQPSVLPVEGATVEDLNRYLDIVNIIDPGSRLLFSAWAVQALIGKGPFPVMVENATQGSGKSTRFRAIKRLIDPSLMDLRSQPRDESELFLGAKNSYLNMFDNLSSITNISDGICKLSTGGSFAKRELYSNTDEIIISRCIPIAMNGITEFASRPDLLDRALFITAKQPMRRKTEVELWRELGEIFPQVLGFLLDAVSFYLTHVENVRKNKTNLARMADFHVTGSTIETFLGFDAGAFDRAYQQNRDHSNDIALESNPLGALIREHIHAITGTRSASKLLEQLRGQCSESDRKLLPRNGKGLSDQLKRIKMPLEACGITFTVGRDSDGRFITIEEKRP